MDINFEYKGIRDLRPKEKKDFKIEDLVFEDEFKTLLGNQGLQILLKDKNTNDLIGNIFLVEDAEDDSWVKIRYVGVENEYLGSGVANLLYDKSVEEARKNRKDLVLDCVATIGAYKSFIKYLNDKNFKYEENPLSKYNEETKQYKAPEHSWTVRVSREEIFK